jgi:hypothetical protein
LTLGDTQSGWRGNLATRFAYVENKLFKNRALLLAGVGEGSSAREIGFNRMDSGYRTKAALSSSSVSAPK